MRRNTSRVLRRRRLKSSRRWKRPFGSDSSKPAGASTSSFTGSTARSRPSKTKSKRPSPKPRKTSSSAATPANPEHVLTNPLARGVVSAAAPFAADEKKSPGRDRRRAAAGLAVPLRRGRGAGLAGRIGKHADSLRAAARDHAERIRSEFSGERGTALPRYQAGVFQGIGKFSSGAGGSALAKHAGEHLKPGAERRCPRETHLSRRRNRVRRRKYRRESETDPSPQAQRAAALRAGGHVGPGGAAAAAHRARDGRRRRRAQGRAGICAALPGVERFAEFARTGARSGGAGRGQPQGTGRAGVARRIQH